MFTTSAELYDAIYFAFKDYPAEAADIARRLAEEHPGARTVLDVGCGTGEHARLLASRTGLQVDGLDLNADFVRLARAKHPTGRFYLGDMTGFALPDRYDAVICMFSSIGYVRTLENLERTLRGFAGHLAPGGVVLVEPWFPPGVLTLGKHSVRSADVGALHVERVASTTVEGSISRLRFDYTITEGARTERLSELHELGLFTEQETLRAFAAAGLDARHEAPSPSNRGLYVARHAESEAGQNRA